MENKNRDFFFKLSVLIIHKKEGLIVLEKLYFINYVPQIKCNLFLNNNVLKRLKC